MMRKGKGFTIVELLVVLAVIGILAAVLIPVFQGATEQARRAGQEAALASVNKALALYVAGHGEEPLKLEGELCGANILHAVQSELGPEVLPELRPEEEFLAYEKESGRVKLFESPPAGYAEADRPDLILPGLVLLDAELLSSFYDPVLSGGSFGAFLDYVKTCPRSYSGELQKYAAGRVFVGSREGKSEVLTVNGGKDLRPVFAKREDALPAAFYEYVTAETAIGCGQPHEAAQLYRLAQEKQELLEYGISGAGLKVGECTLSALISAWRVESFTVDPEGRTVTLSDEHGVLTFAPSGSGEGGSGTGEPDEGGSGGETPHKLTVRIVEKGGTESRAGVALQVQGQEIERAFEQTAEERQIMVLTEGEDFNVGDRLTARLTSANRHLLGGWYIPAEREGYYYQRGLKEYQISEGESEVELWLGAESKEGFDFHGGMIIPNFQGADIAFNTLFEADQPGQTIKLLVSRDFLSKQSSLCFGDRHAGFSVEADGIIWNEDNAVEKRYFVSSRTEGDEVEITFEINTLNMIGYLSKEDDRFTKAMIYADPAECGGGHQMQKDLLGVPGCEDCRSRVYYVVDMFFEEKTQ